jgi:hypothetical protein
VLSGRNFIQDEASSDYKQWLQMMNAASYAEAKQKWVTDITNTINKFECINCDKPLSPSL